MLGFGPISSQPISSVPGAAAGNTYTIVCDAATFVVSAQDATLTRGRVVTADAAAFAIAAQNATLTYTPAAGSYTIVCDSAAFTLSAQDATLIRGRVVTAEPAAFTIAAQNATLTYTPAGSTKRGGDDVPRRIEVWTYRKKKKAIELIRKIADKAEIAEPVSAEVIEAVANAMVRKHQVFNAGAWVARQEEIIQQILEIQQENDDEEALLLLI